MPSGVHLLDFPPQPLGTDLTWRTQDSRAGSGYHQQVKDLFLYRDGIVRNLSNNAPGAHSGGARAVGNDVIFHTGVSAGAADPFGGKSDVMIFDGQATRNLTNVPLNFGARYLAPFGDDLLIEISDESVGSQSHQTATNLFRYTRAGERLPLTDNAIGESSSLIEVRDERVVWHDRHSGRITGIFAGDGSSPPLTVFEPPEDQVLREEGGFDGLRFYELEGGTGEARFSNLLAYVNGEVRALTENGPGWLANLRLPGFIPNYHGEDDAFPEVAIIELITTTGDRRDVMVMHIPEPGLSCAAFLLCAWLPTRRRRRRAAW